VSTRTALGVLTGLGVGAGLLLIAAGWRGWQSDPSTRPARVLPWARIGVGLGTGFVVLVATRWVAVAAALGLLAASWQQLFGGARASRNAIERLEALAGWTESLRDLVATGAALPEALSASLPAAAPVLVTPLAGLVDRLRSREQLEPALHAFAADMNDVSADLVVAALLLNSRAQGRQLHAVLSALARSARQELAMRRAVEAERRSTRRGVRIVLVVTVGMALGLDLLNPGYVAPYRTATGQLVLSVVVAIFGCGFVWLQRLARIPVAGRFLGVGAPRVVALTAPVTEEVAR
jgi:Flp pilus assembly protein TadB